MMNRNAEQHAATPLVSGTCRFEELLLTSANEDESRRLSSVQAIYHLLQNGDEQSPDSPLSDQEESTPVLSHTPSTAPNPFIVSICHESDVRLRCVTCRAVFLDTGFRDEGSTETSPNVLR